MIWNDSRDWYFHNKGLTCLCKFFLDKIFIIWSGLQAIPKQVPWVFRLLWDIFKG